ncbi:MAG TPA: HK97 gp10 family phage protein, partial [Bacteroidales bacterium]|nr:HK97 gp10 family phage protein [Bacteroidales bacterium]
MADFKVEGIDEFQEKLKVIEKKAPDRILDKLDDEGKKLRKEARANTPKKTGKLRKGYILTQVEKIQGGY